MEVHAHAHSHSKKNWKQYFWEFMMLFLAVFCGFLAENFREHQTEHKREKQYMVSLAGELKFDLSEYEIVLKRLSIVAPVLDSLYYNVRNASQFNYRLNPGWNKILSTITIPYLQPMNTIQQLKSSGNLRLIRNQDVEQKIVEYESVIEGRLNGSGRQVSDALHKVYAFEDQLCDYEDFNRSTTKNLQSASGKNIAGSATFEMPILSKDPFKLNEFANSFVNYRAFLYGYYTNINFAQSQTNELLMLIQKEYHLK